MPKIELQKQHKMYLAVCCLVLLGSAAGSYYVWKECGELDLEAGTLEGRVQAAKVKLAKIDDLEEQVIILRENLHEYVRILPSDNEVNDLYRFLGEFAASAGLQITRLTPQAERRATRNTQAFQQAVYTMRFNATYQQFLQYVNRLENHERFISLGNIKMQSGESRKGREDAEQMVHNCDLTIVTYVYLGDEPGTGKGVQIAGYDRKRAQLAEQIQEKRLDMRLERFQLLTEGVRRDPMVDPRKRELGADGEGGEAIDVESQQALIDEALATIEECDALFGLMTRAGSVMRQMELRVEGWNLLTELQARIDLARVQGDITDPKLKRIFENTVLPELARLRQAFGSEAMEGEDRDRIRMEKTVAQMRTTYQEHEYEACVKAYEVLITVVPAANHPDLVALQEEMDALYLNATTALAFQEMEIEVSGLVMYPKMESVAIVNGVVYREGEAVTDELFLMEIFEDRLVFEYRGVLLTFDL